MLIYLFNTKFISTIVLKLIRNSPPAKTATDKTNAATNAHCFYNKNAQCSFLQRKSTMMIFIAMKIDLAAPKILKEPTGDALISLNKIADMC